MKFRLRRKWAGGSNWSQWTKATAGADTTVRRISELPHRVYFEVEERHQIDDMKIVVNSMTVFEFGEDGKIHHLDVFLQQPPPNG